MPIVVDIDVMLAKRKMPVGALAERVGMTPGRRGPPRPDIGALPQLSHATRNRCRLVMTLSR